MTQTRPSATPTIQIENDWMITTEWRFPPRGETGWHVHQYDYVVVPVVTGQLLIETPDGEHTAELVTGQSYTRNEGVEHNVINNNDYEFVFIEVERK